MTVAPIRLTVPPRLTAGGIDALRRALADVAPGMVAVLRAGAPGPFCAGLDFNDEAVRDAGALRAGLRAFGDLLLQLSGAHVPTIAVVEGETFGGGVGLAAACDLVLASEAARFGLPEALYGFHPAMVFAVLDQRLAPQRSRLLALQCESIDAPAALAAGLADLVVAPVELEASIQREVRRLSRALPAGVAATKGHAPHRERLATALDAALQVTLAQLIRPDVRERIAERAQ